MWRSSRWRTSWHGSPGRCWQKERTIIGQRSFARTRRGREWHEPLPSLLKAHQRDSQCSRSAARRGWWGMPERCSPARIRFAALTHVLACSAPFRQISACDGRLRREHKSTLALKSIISTSVCQARTNEMAEQSNGVPQACYKKRSIWWPSSLLGRARANPHRGQELAPQVGRIHFCRLLPASRRFCLTTMRRTIHFYKTRQNEGQQAFGPIF
jgi:hypothetical protein